MLSKLAVRRLTKLADYMDGLPRSANKHFNMRAWFIHEGLDDHGLLPTQSITKRELNLCGTTACALGWAAMCPTFKRLGLGLRADDSVLLKGRNRSFEVISKKVFDLPYYDGFEDLFIYLDVNTPKQWAKHCRKFLRANAHEREHHGS